MLLLYLCSKDTIDWQITFVSDTHIINIDIIEAIVYSGMAFYSIQRGTKSKGATDL